LRIYIVSELSFPKSIWYRYRQRWY